LRSRQTATDVQVKVHVVTLGVVLPRSRQMWFSKHRSGQSDEVWPRNGCGEIGFL